MSLLSFSFILAACAANEAAAPVDKAPTANERTLTPSRNSIQSAALRVISASRVSERPFLVAAVELNRGAPLSIPTGNYGVWRPRGVHPIEFESNAESAGSEEYSETLAEQTDPTVDTLEILASLAGIASDCVLPVLCKFNGMRQVRAQARGFVRCGPLFRIFSEAAGSYESSEPPKGIYGLLAGPSAPPLRYSFLFAPRKHACYYWRPSSFQSGRSIDMHIGGMEIFP